MISNIRVQEDMIAEFDIEQPKPGRETTAFIKRWRKKEMELPHSSPNHLSRAVDLINHAEIESIRRTKKFRDAPRKGNNQLVDCVEVQ